MPTSDLLAIVKLLLPEVLITHFELKKYKIEGEEIDFYFTEFNTIPDEFMSSK